MPLPLLHTAAAYPPHSVISKRLHIQQQNSCHYLILLFGRITPLHLLSQLSFAQLFFPCFSLRYFHLLHPEFLLHFPPPPAACTPPTLQSPPELSPLPPHNPLSSVPATSAEPYPPPPENAVKVLYPPHSRRLYTYTAIIK